MTLGCFERAISLASDDNMADIWYNVGQVAIGIGDLGLAYQAFKVAISIDCNHAESFNNLGVLELRKGNIDQAKTNFQTATQLAAHIFEPHFNWGKRIRKLGIFGIDLIFIYLLKLMFFKKKPFYLLNWETSKKLFQLLQKLLNLIQNILNPWNCNRN